MSTDQSDILICKNIRYILKNFPFFAAHIWRITTIYNKLNEFFLAVISKMNVLSQFMFYEQYSGFHVL